MGTGVKAYQSLLLQIHISSFCHPWLCSESVSLYVLSPNHPSIQIWVHVRIHVHISA